MIERAFTVLAALMVIASAVCLWRDNVTAAFVTAVLGVLAWFLSYRFRLRANPHLTDDHVPENDDDHDDN